MLKEPRTEGVAILGIPGKASYGDDLGAESLRMRSRQQGRVGSIFLSLGRWAESERHTYCT